MTPRDVLRELLANGPGKAGLGLLVLLVAVAIYALASRAEPRQD